jgi:hypothetical protein
MHLTRLAFALLVLAIVGLPNALPVAAGSAQLIAAPHAGHPGELTYVSGGGFPAHARISLFMTCADSGIERAPAAVTDGHGAFSGVAVKAMPLPTKSAQPCSFVASSGGKSSMRARSNTYWLYPPGRSLPRCAAQMCLSVKAFLVRLRNGAQGNITISGWPGATADVTVARVEAGAKFRRVRLNWRGLAQVRMWVAPGLIKGVMAQVYVQARLGRSVGQAKAPFHVMPGGR